MTDTELEEQLTALFSRRAADIQRMPTVNFPPAKSARTRFNVAPFAVAAAVAAVVVAAGATIVSIRSGHRTNPSNPATSQILTPPPSVSSPSATLCPQIGDPTGWPAAIERGSKVTLDHPNNTVVSVNGSRGEYLLLQTTPAQGQTAAVFGQATLAVFNGGSGQDVAALPAGSTDIPQVDPAGAIAADWIVYGLAHPQSAGTYYQVRLYDRRDSTTTTIDQLSDSASTAGQVFLGQPVIFQNHAYWLQSVYNDPSQSVLKSYDLGSGNMGSSQVPGATSLLDYGTGIATIAGYDTTSVVTPRLGRALPAQVLTAMQGASGYAYDAPAPGASGSGTLHWTSLTAAQTSSYFSNQVGQSRVDRTVLKDYGMSLSISTGPFAEIDPITDSGAGGQQLLDSRTGQRTRVPLGYSLQAVVGPTAIFGTGTSKFGSSGLVLVPLSGLAPAAVRC